MSAISLIVLVWGAAAIGIGIMKKLQPEDKIYPIWVAIVCIVFTAFVGHHVSWW